MTLFFFKEQGFVGRLISWAALSPLQSTRFFALDFNVIAALIIHHIKRATRHLIFWTLIASAVSLTAVRLLLWDR